ncbi:metallophosphoesterase [Paraglaciecola sp. 2405UD69-4]|uniref:metallophosphoesterase n=1 Tax=Paraglaciecola sp. 2405UD69-4 TaxID=3391836 RepID=UPI0039C9F149
MKIVQISDCHLFADKQKNGYKDINPYQSLRNILGQVSVEQIALLLVTGDLSGDASALSYQHFKQLLVEANLDCKLLILPGNHDSIEHLKATFPEENLWFRSPISLDDTNWQLHLLNSQFEGALGNVSRKDLELLEQALQQAPDKSHLIAVHHHPINCNGWMDKHEWLNRQDFTQLVELYPNVKVVVYGHIHSDIETQQNGVLYLACPSTCWQWANTESFGLSDEKPGYRVIELQEGGQFNHEINRIN